MTACLCSARLFPFYQANPADDDPKPVRMQERSRQPRSEAADVPEERVLKITQGSARMSRGNPAVRLHKARTTKANHGQKPCKGRKKGWPRYKEIMAKRRARD